MEATTSSHETLACPRPQQRRNRWILWTGRILLGLLALIVLLAASGATRRSCVPTTRGAIHLRATGGCWRPPLAPELRRTGQPDRRARCRVGRVLARLGCGPAPDRHTQPASARTAPASAGATPGPATPQPAQADELHTLLTNAGVEGPYVLVATPSLARRHDFASQHPNQVAGMVLIDARHESVDDHLRPSRLRPRTPSSSPSRT